MLTLILICTATLSLTGWLIHSNKRRHVVHRVTRRPFVTVK